MWATTTGLSWPPPAFRCRAGILVCSSLVSWWAKIAPNADTPIDPPICWKNVRELLATPMSLMATLFCATSVVICMRKPMPIPSTTKNRPEVTRLVLTFSMVSKYMATVMTAPPMIGSAL